MQVWEEYQQVSRATRLWRRARCQGITFPNVGAIFPSNFPAPIRAHPKE